MSTQIPDIWRDYDLMMLKFAVELQISNNGTFPLDQLLDKVGLLDRGDSYTGLTPWKLTESLRRLTEGGFILFLSDPLAREHEDEDDNYLEELKRRWLDADNEKREGEIDKEIRQRERELELQLEARRRRIEEAFFKGMEFEDAHWRGGRFYIDGAVHVCELRATPTGLRRGGAWPDPEKLSDDLIAVLGDLA